MIDYNLIADKLSEVSEIIKVFLTQNYLRLSQKDILYKDDKKEIVSEIDIAIEKRIVQFLTEFFPSAKFIGEESYISSMKTEGNELTFIIDPIDGTSNYVYGIGYFALSIGVKHSDEFVGGIVVAPMLNESFLAIKNCLSVYKYNQNISSIEDFSKNQHSHASKYLIGTTYPCVNTIIGKLSKKISVRIFGSIAITFCYALVGKLDGFISNCAKIWDIAGGLGIANALGLKYFLKYNAEKDSYLIIFHRDLSELEKLRRLFDEG